MCFKSSSFKIALHSFWFYIWTDLRDSKSGARTCYFFFVEQSNSNTFISKSDTGPWFIFRRLESSHKTKTLFWNSSQYFYQGLTDRKCWDGTWLRYRFLLQSNLPGVWRGFAITFTPCIYFSTSFYFFCFSKILVNSTRWSQREREFIQYMVVLWRKIIQPLNDSVKFCLLVLTDVWITDFLYIYINI